MSFVKNVLGFEGFNLKHMGDKIADNPMRLLYGGIDPFSTKLWNKVLNKDDKPLVDQMGGASSDTYTAAREAGVPTSDGKTMHDIAHVIAAFEAGGYGANQLGAAGGGLSGAGAGGVEGGVEGGLAGGTAGGAAAEGGATVWNPALIDSALGTPGYGASSAGAGGGAGELAVGGAGGGTANNPWWKNLMQQRGGMPGMGGQQPQNNYGLQANQDLLKRRREVEEALMIAAQRGQQP